MDGLPFKYPIKDKQIQLSQSRVNMAYYAVSRKESLDVVREVLKNTEVQHGSDLLALCVVLERYDVLNYLKEINHSVLDGLKSSQSPTQLLDGRSASERRYYFEGKYSCILLWLPERVKMKELSEQLISFIFGVVDKSTISEDLFELRKLMNEHDFSFNNAWALVLSALERQNLIDMSVTKPGLENARLAL